MRHARSVLVYHATSTEFPQATNRPDDLVRLVGVAKALYWANAVHLTAGVGVTEGEAFQKDRNNWFERLAPHAQFAPNRRGLAADQAHYRFHLIPAPDATC